VDYFWDQSLHNGVFGVHYIHNLSFSFPDGQRSDGVDCYLGKKKFNAEDSPYRHYYQFFLDATEKGVVPESWWTRPWEGDMEASYIGGKSVMLLLGPWLWDKALAGDPNVKQLGMPDTPPAEGQSVWIQGANPPSIDQQYFIRAGNENTEHWEQTKEAWNWFFSPEVIPLRAQGEGRVPLYKLDEALDLKGPQYVGVLKDIANPDGQWPDVKWEQGLTGEVMAGPYLKKGATGVWDWQSSNNLKVMTDVVTKKITVQEALDIAQQNWEASYEGIPEA